MANSWHVDDGLGIAPNSESIKEMVTQIGDKFTIKVLGTPKFILGIKIERDRFSRTLRLSQTSYIETIAKRFDVTESTKPTSSPLDTNVVLQKNNNGVDPAMINVPYASAIGSLNYCAVATRPDIAFAVNRLAQFISSPTPTHWNAIQRVIKYLLSTKSYGITFGGMGSDVNDIFGSNLTGFSDADFAGDPDSDRHSTTGWVFRFDGGPISWASKKQHLVTRSSFESELVSNSFASAEGIWLLRLANEFKLDLRPIPLYTDNKSVIAFTTNHISHDRTKHIDNHFHYTKEEIENGNIRIFHIPGTDNPADILTKALAPYKHKQMRDILGVRPIENSQA